MGKLKLAGITLAAFAAHAAFAEDAAPRIDFRYRPSHWETMISFPDDWQKTLVDDRGVLLYDYPGPFSRHRIDVQLGTLAPGSGAFEALRAAKQELRSPRVPVIATEAADASGGIRVSERAFALVPESTTPSRERAVVARTGYAGIPGVQSSQDAVLDWAQVPAGYDVAFAHAAVGWERKAIRYTIAVEKGARRDVALGVLEGWHKVRGQRLLETEVEGAPVRVVDSVPAGALLPQVFTYAGRDVDGDGLISIRVQAAARAPDGNAVLSAIWVFAPGQAPAPGRIASGAANASAIAYLDCGFASVNPSVVNPPYPRRDGLVAEVGGGRPARLAIRVRTRDALGLDTTTGALLLGGKPFALTSPRAIALRLDAEGGTLELPPTARAELTVLRGDRAIPATPDLDRELAKTVAWWESARLPWDKIRVPDPGIQALLDGSHRNFAQLREVVDGYPEYRGGPTMYRGFWFADGAFEIESRTLLGDVEDARRAIDGELRFQDPATGKISKLQGDFYKETGLVLWTLFRHAQMTRDPAWLATHWETIARAVEWIRTMRKLASADPRAPEFGLIPPGMSDGGIQGPAAEYTNVYWNLIGLKSAVRSARMLGHEEEARSWEAEYADFDATFRRAAARDLKVDEHGNRFLPILMGFDASRNLPQKAQWAFCQAVYPGELFGKDDPIAGGTLAMLDSFESEGLVLGTGWMDDGIWTYFASFYAHAHLQLEHHAKAQSILYAFGNHASPLLAWREEQRPAGQGDRTVGDMPHGWANVEFPRLTRNLIAFERGDELELLRGVPTPWYLPGSVTELNGLVTRWGTLDFRVEVAADGATARIELAPLGGPEDSGAPTLDLSGLESMGYVARPESLRGLVRDPATGRFRGQWGRGFRVELDRR